MSRQQAGKGKGKPSGRGHNTTRKTSYARGNSPIKKVVPTNTPKLNTSNPHVVRPMFILQLD